jgi:hypothetical protein
MAQPGQRRNRSRHLSPPLGGAAVAQFGKLLYRRLAVGQRIPGPALGNILAAGIHISVAPAPGILLFALSISQRAALTHEKVIKSYQKSSKVIKSRLPAISAHTTSMKNFKNGCVWLLLVVFGCVRRLSYLHPTRHFSKFLSLSRFVVFCHVASSRFGSKTRAETAVIAKPVNRFLSRKLRSGAPRRSGFSSPAISRKNQC